MPPKPRKIIGIDPGFGRVGYGVIEEKGREWRAVAYGCIITSPKRTLIERLQDIKISLQELLEKYQPTQAAVEELFFYKNVTTALQVAQARGVIVTTLADFNLTISEFTPLEIKQSVTNYGRADKQQMQTMVALLLRLSDKKIQDDAADALAVALTCAAVIHRPKIKNS